MTTGHYDHPLHNADDGDGPMKERESPNAMPPPWASAWGLRRGWPVKLPESRVGPLMPMWPTLTQRQGRGLGSPDTLALYHPNVPIFYRQRTGPGAPPPLRTLTYHPVYGYHPTVRPSGFAPPSAVTRGSGQFPGLRDPRPTVTRGSGQFPGFREGGRLGALGDDWWSDGGGDGGAWPDDSGDSGPLLGADPGGAWPDDSGDSGPLLGADPGGAWPDDSGDSGPLTGAQGESFSDWWARVTSTDDSGDSGPLLGADPAGVIADAESGAGDAVRAAGDLLKSALGVVPALFRGLFPAGLPPLWTPCPKTMFWNGHSCQASPVTQCPSGYVLTQVGCRPTNLLCSTLGVACGGEGGGGGEEGGGEGGFFEGSQSLTASPWFWPAVLGGGGLIVLVAVRRR